MLRQELVQINGCGVILLKIAVIIFKRNEQNYEFIKAN